MSAPMKHLSVAEITAKLAEIAEKEAAHNARDFDAELRKVMVEGGDIDALENAQLDAEKQARRLRVHRSALEADLPIARKREAEIVIKEKHDEHVALRPEAAKSAGGIVTDEALKLAGITPQRMAKEGFAPLCAELFELCRREKGINPMKPENPPLYGIGGFIEHTVVSAAGVTTTKIKEWPDEIGKPIDPFASIKLDAAE